MSDFLSNAFDVFIDYALDNRPALFEAILVGDALPAIEQPCWECGRLRYFWDTHDFGFIEQCATERPKTAESMYGFVVREKMRSDSDGGGREDGHGTQGEPAAAKPPLEVGDPDPLLAHETPVTNPAAPPCGKNCVCDFASGKHTEDCQRNQEQFRALEALLDASKKFAQEQGERDRISIETWKERAGQTEKELSDAHIYLNHLKVPRDSEDVKTGKKEGLNLQGRIRLYLVPKQQLAAANDRLFEPEPGIYVWDGKAWSLYDRDDSHPPEACEPDDQPDIASGSFNPSGAPTPCPHDEWYRHTPADPCFKKPPAKEGK